MVGALENGVERPNGRKDSVPQHTSEVPAVAQIESLRSHHRGCTVLGLRDSAVLYSFWLYLQRNFFYSTARPG